LEIIQNPFPKGNEPEIYTSGNQIEAIGKDNICIKAWILLKQDFPQLPEIKIHLHKVIPAGAGLGGGSADGAFTIHLLNKKFNLGLSDQQLLDYALKLGSDCPFFIKNRPCYATSRGEQLEEISLDLSPYRIMLVNPGIHISTGWAFSKLSLFYSSKSIKETIQQPIDTWKEELKNDFEKAVFGYYPEIKKIKEGLYNQGAIYASLSGSGSTVFGIFKKETTIENTFPKQYFHAII
jgi:4-diphosphocytidyl-2-C-methyl-D-erythritol kinase